MSRHDLVRSLTRMEHPIAYAVPMVVEQTSRGERAYDIFSLLLKNGSSFLARRLTTRSRT